MAKAELVEINGRLGKRCGGLKGIRCDRVLPLECFSVRPGGAGGRNSVCLECMQKYNHNPRAKFEEWVKNAVGNRVHRLSEGAFSKEWLRYQFHDVQKGICLLTGTELVPGGGTTSGATVDRIRNWVTDYSIVDNLWIILGAANNEKGAHEMPEFIRERLIRNEVWPGRYPTTEYAIELAKQIEKEPEYVARRESTELVSTEPQDTPNRSGVCTQGSLWEESPTYICKTGSE